MGAITGLRTYESVVEDVTCDDERWPCLGKAVPIFEHILLEFWKMSYHQAYNLLHHDEQKTEITCIFEEIDRSKERQRYRTYKWAWWCYSSSFGAPCKMTRRFCVDFCDISLRLARNPSLKEFQSDFHCHLVVSVQSKNRTCPLKVHRRCYDHFTIRYRCMRWLR